VLELGALLWGMLGAVETRISSMVLGAATSASSTAGPPVAAAAVVVTGTPVPGTPIVGSANPSTGVVSGTAVFTGPTGAVLIYSVPLRTSGGGTVSVNSRTGVFTYTPTAAQRKAATGTTTDTFTVTASIGANQATETVTVPVDAGTPVALAPTAGAPNNSTGAINGTARFTTPAGRTLTYSAPAISTGGATVVINAGTGAFTYTPTTAQRQTATATTTDTFTVTVTNGVYSTSETVTVPVGVGKPTAGLPKVGTPSQASGAVTGTTVFTDPQGLGLTYSAPTTSTHGGTVSIDSTTGAFSYTPTTTQRQTATAFTTDTFTVTATNGVQSTNQTVTVHVGVGSPVTGSAIVNTPNPGTGVVTGSAVDTDPQGRTLTYSSPVRSAHGAAVTVDATTGAFTYTPTIMQRLTANSSTTDTFTVTATNGVARTTQTITVAVSPNDKPIAGTPTVGAPNTGTGVVTGTLGFTDPGRKALTYTVTTAPSQGAVNITATGAYTYTPTPAARQAAGPNTTDTFTVTANDGIGTTTQTVTVPISAISPVIGTWTLQSYSSPVPVSGDPVPFVGTPAIGTHAVVTASGSGYAASIPYLFGPYRVTISGTVTQTSPGVFSGTTSPSIDALVEAAAKAQQPDLVTVAFSETATVTLSSSNDNQATATVVQSWSGTIRNSSNVVVPFSGEVAETVYITKV
jgi:VCBS repeat-containing protein